MTEAAISGSAEAPAEASGAPIDIEAASHSSPLGSQAPVDQEKIEAREQVSISEAIRKANEAVKARAAEKEAKEAGEKANVQKPEAKPNEVQPAKEAKAPNETKLEAEPAKAERERATDGKFAAKQEAAPPEVKPEHAIQQTGHREPPARFSADAKAAWEQAPEPVKAEVHRALRELEQGHQKYRADAEAWNEIRDYDSLAKQHNTTVRAALDNYVGIERLLAKDPIAGIERVIANMGMKAPDGRPLTLQDIAGHVLNQTPDQAAARQTATIQELNQKIAQLEQQLGGVTQTIHQQRASSLEEKVTAFAAKPENARFDELAGDIKFFLETGRATTLEEAYSLAERLNPAPAAAASAAPSKSAPEEKPPLNPAGQKSIHGAPASGSSPAGKPLPIPSTREALKRAMARVSA